MHVIVLFWRNMQVCNKSYICRIILHLLHYIIIIYILGGSLDSMQRTMQIIVYTFAS